MLFPFYDFAHHPDHAVLYKEGQFFLLRVSEVTFSRSFEVKFVYSVFMRVQVSRT